MKIWMVRVMISKVSVEKCVVRLSRMRSGNKCLVKVVSGVVSLGGSSGR